MVFIIAEIGINHNGSLSIAKKLIDIAVSADCDAVKFQKRDVEKIYSKKFLDSQLQSPWGTTQRDMRLHREFSLKQFKEINKYCKERKIPLFISCWDIYSQIQMRKLKTKYNKVASAMLLHHKLLETIASEGKYTFISTGMSTMKDIEKAVKIFRKHKCPFELMHSHSSYPMKLEEANLKVIQTLQKKFKCNVGYSGHETSAYLVCIVAVMFGATSIERHITLDRTMYGTDHAASLEPQGLFRMVRDMRNLKKTLGDGKKKIWDSELSSMNKLRQSFV